MIILFIASARLYPVFLDSLANKPIRIGPSEHPEWVLSELHSDFGRNPFRVVDGSDVPTGHGIRAQINRNGPRFRIRVGGSELCRDKKSLVKCAKKPDLWDIDRHGSEFLISQKGHCLGIEGDRLALERCKGPAARNLFLIQDAELETCLDSLDLDDEPVTEAEAVRQLKVKKRLAELEKSNKEAAEKIRKKAESKRDFNKFVEKAFPAAKEKEDIKKVLKSLWDFGWKKPRRSWRFHFPNWSFPFCTKLW